MGYLYAFPRWSLIKITNMKQHIKRITKRLLSRVLHKSLLEEFSSKKRELDSLYQMRLSHLTPIDQPLVLISQIPRSGGTLLSQLFDGHPQCHTHPLELKIGYPQRGRWPDLDLNASAEVWFKQLFEPSSLRLFRKGYQKYPKKLYNRSDNFPFIFLPNLQRAIFLNQVTKTEITSQREVLNCYMTSYFNAWIDYQELYRFHKKYLVAFTPRFVGCKFNDFPSICEADTNRFFKDYPDGKLLSIVRDPKTWFVSAHRYGFNSVSDLQKGMALWKASAKIMLTNKKQYGDQVYLLRFENLLQETEKTMRGLAEYLGLTFNESLVKPTFQGMDIRANSVDAVQKFGILPSPLERDNTLTQDEIAYIRAETQELYETVLLAIN